MGEALGFASCLIAGVCFGSNFIPAKKYEIGDGVFFQWVMCCAIWIAGLVTLGFSDDREFHPLTMIGGMLWCTGNFLCLQVIKMIGMSMGLMLWGIINSVVGWACGRFGLFGLEKEHVSDPVLNYVGLALTVLSLAAFAHVKTNVGNNNQMREPLLDNEEGNTKPVAVHTINPKFRSALGFGVAMLCGLLFGLTFVPCENEIARAKHGKISSSTKEIDYVFSHFSGIFATSTAIMLGYSVYMKNRPVIHPEILLPAFGSGTIWAIAQIFWFVAIQNLRMVVANPIVTVLPSIVAGFWGIVLFREIEGVQNLALWGAGLVVAVIGVILVAVSK